MLFIEVKNDTLGPFLIFTAQVDTAATSLVSDPKRSNENSNRKQHLHKFLRVKRVFFRLEVTRGDERTLRGTLLVRTERSS
jgi:hypothetical protein